MWAPISLHEFFSRLSAQGDKRGEAFLLASARALGMVPVAETPARVIRDGASGPLPRSAFRRPPAHTATEVAEINSQASAAHDARLADAADRRGLDREHRKLQDVRIADGVTFRAMSLDLLDGGRSTLYALDVQDGSQQSVEDAIRTARRMGLTPQQRSDFMDGGIRWTVSRGDMAAMMKTAVWRSSQKATDGSPNTSIVTGSRQVIRPGKHRSDVAL